MSENINLSRIREALSEIIEHVGPDVFVNEKIKECNARLDLIEDQKEKKNQTDIPFIEDLRRVLSRYDDPNDSDTPDYIMVNYVRRCIDAANILINQRENHYGRRSDKTVTGVIKETQE